MTAKPQTPLSTFAAVGVAIAVALGLMLIFPATREALVHFSYIVAQTTWTLVQNVAVTIATWVTDALRAVFA